MQPQVVGDEACRVPVRQRPGSVDGEVLGDPLDRPQPVGEDAVLEPALGDRRRAVLPHAPLVDRRGEHVDAARDDVGGDRDGDVLVHHALREPERVGVPERPPPQLVPRGAVGEQRPAAAHVRPLPRAGERAGEELRLRGALAREALDVARREVRAGPLERAQQPLVRVGRDDVVGVREGEELAARGARPGVARAAQPAVWLRDQPEAPVAAGEALGERAAAVGRPVVDHDHLQVADRLAGERLQARREVALDVVDRDDHADPGHVRMLATRGGATVATG